MPGRADQLQDLLPDGCTLAEPSWTIQVTALSNLHWFGGHGYEIVAVHLPVRYDDGTQHLDAEFMPVLWESKADPIVTGRDELGFPKIFADIEAGDLASDLSGPVRISASWEGTRFLRLGMDDPTSAGLPTPALPVITRRYLPRVGELTTTEIDHLTVSEPGVARHVTVLASVAGTGTVEVKPVTWRQVPFQYPVINALSALSITGPVTARATVVQGIFGGATNRRL